MKQSGELQRFRILFLIAAVLYPTWSLVAPYNVTHAYDPLWQRIAVGALMLLGLGASYASVWVRRNIGPVFAFCILLLTLHFLALTHVSGLHLIYTARALLIVIFASATFLSRRLLLGYGLCVVGSSALVAALAAPGPNRILLPVAVAVVVLVALAFLSNTLRLIEKLAERETNFRQLFDSTFESICIHDEGTIIDVNAPVSRLFGYPPEEMIGRKLLDFICVEDRDFTKQIVPGDGEPMIEVTGIRRDGTRVTLEVHRKPYSYQGRILTLVAMRDTTERKSMETRLRLADRMASIGTLAAGVGHEINNPLFLVTGNLDALKTLLRKLFSTHPPPGAAANEALDVLERAQEGAERVRVIVRDLKVLTRQDEDTMGPIDIAKLLDSSIAIVSNQIRHRTRLVKEYGSVPPVFGNEARLGQVFVNLLVNAVQATDELSMSHNEIRVRLYSGADGRVVIEVSDNGKGMTREVQEHIFEPFFTTKEIGSGTGLGLTICHRIVVSLGGEISVDSKVGEGTTFRVSLAPVAAAAPHDSETPVKTVAEAPAPAPAAAAPRFRILIVDDEPFVSSLIASYLGDHEVELASNGREGLGKVANGGGFDVILSDLMMPEMSGMELYQEIKRKFPGIQDRMVFMSGGAFTPLSKAFLESIPNRLVEKPFDLEELKQLLLQVGSSHT